MELTALSAPSRLRLSVRVQPRASRSRVVGEHAGALKVQLQAPPVEGAANAALIDLLARSLGVRRADVAIVSGAKSRTKIVEIATAEPQALARAVRGLGVSG